MFRVSACVVVATLAMASAAAADVRISVPSSLLGGRVAPGNPLPPPDPSDPPVDPNDRDAGEIDLADPDFWPLVWPSEAAAIAAPAEVVFDCDEDTNPTSCGIWGDDATTLSPAGANVHAAGDPVPPSTTNPSRRLRPAIGTWMVSQTPRLSWTPTSGASHYNVQIYLGSKRVASAWTTRPELVVPPRVIDQGRYYMWSVWPATGPRTRPTFGEQIGRSVFGVVLRPRVVFRATANGVRGEVRPRIPGGVLRVSGPADLMRRVPTRVRISPASRIVLRVSLRDAERLTFRLLDVGQRPPKGLRRP